MYVQTTFVSSSVDYRAGMFLAQVSIPTIVVAMLAALLFGQASADGVQFFQPPVGGVLSQGSMVSQGVPVPMVPSAAGLSRDPGGQLFDSNDSTQCSAFSPLQLFKT